MERLQNVDMREFTSFKAGGKAREMVILESVEELREIMGEIHRLKKKYIVLGNGSNTLIKDSGFDGIVVKLGEAFNKVTVEGERLICGTGALMSVVAKAALAADLTGFEFASGIPGSIGGAIFMNAGAYGGEMKDIVESVTLVKNDGSETISINAADLDLSYRHSILEDTRDVAVTVTLKLKKGNHEEIAGRMAELTKRRNEKQPVQYPSAGSFFKRPAGYFAGKLIQDAGLKGATVGGAQVSDLHSGFIINKGGATATDIIDLMHLVQNTVYDKFGVRLEPEVRIIGDER
ncbi:UDP-N-acetylmuramate dehydrogenase [Emergencia timonensis]|uniref:UDP-N-acetylmuramate dehydrogenase n=1 Tax=Emergencia timonensis TaxID=1776384 RepID=UPI000835A3CB|nr:UDP-N-acetylmuramate dehydrogenase [Emergencia timonensis]WNX88169.1 UDP-N-acetylmuramate dehydrogenase [Emergencia timonensis]